MGKSNEQIAVEVTRNTLLVNVLLSFFQLFAGIISNSSAMVSDAVHSFSDVLADMIVIVGIKLSSKKPDKEHPYGHERFECVAGIILAFILFSVGSLIGWGGFQRIISGHYDELLVPGALALTAAITGIIIKETMFWYTIAASKKTNSVALKASAWHHRSDAMSSIGSFLGILGARMGFPVLDSVACVVISFFILKVAFDVFKESIDKMVDKSCDDKVVDEIRAAALEQENVLGVDYITTRMFGNKIYVDLEICTDGSATLNEAHDVAQQVHNSIETRFSDVKHCMVHVNPAKE